MSREALWTLDDLTAQVALALSVDYEGSASGRVRDVPDRRTIRYYTTLGLIDRPVQMRGRTALYGRRHLLQLVAIKKLQASGQSLAEVQQALGGQTDGSLAQVAELDGPDWARGGTLLPQRRPARDFWRQSPAAHVPAPFPEAGGEVRGQRTGPPEDPRPQTFQGVPLADGVTLLLASSRPIDGQDLEAIRAAAA